jgi:hypothetical protein
MAAGDVLHEHEQITNVRKRCGEFVIEPLVQTQNRLPDNIEDLDDAEKFDTVCGSETKIVNSGWPFVGTSFLMFQKRENELHKLTVVQLLSGQTYRPKRVYRITNERVSNVVADYSNRIFITFLRGIAHNLYL